jgi:hypothetical protein
MQANLVYQASGLTGWLDDKVDSANGIVTGVCVVAGIVIGIVIIVQRPTFGRAILGVCVGAFIAGLPWLIPAVGDLFKEDVEAAGPPASVVEEHNSVNAQAVDSANTYTLTL